MAGFAVRGQPESARVAVRPEARTETVEVSAADGTSGGYELVVR